MSQQSDKVEKDVNASTANKLLVICIDRDNDVGEKAGIIYTCCWKRCMY